MLTSNPPMEDKAQNTKQLDKKAIYWQQHVVAYQQCKHTKRVYCDTHHINYHQFIYWCRKFVREANASDHAFLPVKIKPTTLSHEPLATLELGGKCLRIHNEMGLQVLLSYLG